MAPKKQKLKTTSSNYLAYPAAITQLNQRLHTTPEELAMWIFLGESTGGLNAYLCEGEGDIAQFRRFSFQREAAFNAHLEPVAALMRTWFDANEIQRFKPRYRYLTLPALVERWSANLVIQVESFILAKALESRLEMFHPISGLLNVEPDMTDLKHLRTAVVSLEEVLRIEAEDGLQLVAPGPAPSLAPENEIPVERRARVLRVVDEERRKSPRKFYERAAARLGMSVSNMKRLMFWAPKPQGATAKMARQLDKSD